MNFKQLNQIDFLIIFTGLFLLYLLTQEKTPTLNLGRITEKFSDKRGQIIFKFHWTHPSIDGKEDTPHQFYKNNYKARVFLFSTTKADDPKFLDGTGDFDFENRGQGSNNLIITQADKKGPVTPQLKIRTSYDIFKNFDEETEGLAILRLIMLTDKDAVKDYGGPSQIFKFWKLSQLPYADTTESTNTHLDGELRDDPADDKFPTDTAGSKTFGNFSYEFKNKNSSMMKNFYETTYNKGDILLASLSNNINWDQIRNNKNEGLFNGSTKLVGPANNQVYFDIPFRISKDTFGHLYTEPIFKNIKISRVI